MYEGKIYKKEVWWKKRHPIPWNPAYVPNAQKVSWVKYKILTSWWADLRVRSVWRASRIFLSTYLQDRHSMVKLTERKQLSPLDENWNTRASQAHFFFSTLCLTKSAEPNAPFPICSNTSYWSIFVGSAAHTQQVYPCPSNTVPEKNKQFVVNSSTPSKSNVRTCLAQDIL